MYAATYEVEGRKTSWAPRVLLVMAAATLTGAVLRVFSSMGRAPGG